MKLLFEDTRRIENAIQNIRIEEKRFNTVLIAFDKLGLKIKMNRELLLDLIKSPENTIKVIYLERIPEIDPTTKLKVNREAILRGLQLPDLKELKQATDHLNPEQIDLFNIGAEITLDDVKLQSYLDRFRVYAKSSEELSLYERLKALEGNLNELDKLVGLIPSRDKKPSAMTFNLGELFGYNNGVILKAEGFTTLSRRLTN
jgi:hypothetical protein